jgi:dTDP-4-dehydrorhamnose reductase
MLGKKILITGSGGLLGSTIAAEFQKYEILTPRKDELDITQLTNVRTYINKHQPDIIIHTAAHTNLEEAEINNQKAWLTNMVGTLNICNTIVDTTCKLVYISSTGIYGKLSESPWCEFDIPVPTTIHHKSKYEAEKVIRHHIKNHLILRTGWLFGGPLHNAKNFVYNRYKEACANDILTANAIQRGNPTCAIDLSKQIELLLKEEIIGTYNTVNSGSVSRLEYIKDILSFFNLETEVIPSEGKYQRLADVSDNEMATNYLLDMMGLNIMNDYKTSLKRYIDTIKIN